MNLDNTILFLKGEALLGNFTEEQENNLCDKAEELRTVGLNIFKARSVLNDYEKMYIEFGGDENAFEEHYKDFKRTGGKQLKMIKAIGKGVIKSGKTIDQVGKEIKGFVGRFK